MGASADRGTGVDGLAVNATSPLSDSVVAGPVSRVVVSFTQQLDLSLINETTVSLERLAGVPDEMGGPPTGARIRATLSVPEGNGSTLLVTPDVPLVAGDYRLRLRGSGPAALADVNARGLGADYSFSFTVEAAP
jgi:hypothetical protein